MYIHFLQTKHGLWQSRVNPPPPLLRCGFVFGVVLYLVFPREFVGQAHKYWFSFEYMVRTVASHGKPLLGVSLYCSMYCRGSTLLMQLVDVDTSL